MKHLTLGLCLLLTACGHRQLTPKPAPHAEPITVVVPPATPGQPVRPIRIGRKSTVSVYYAPATVTTNTAGKKAVAGTQASLTGATKAKGSAVVAQDSAVVSALSGSGNLNTAQGQHATASATQTKQDTTHEAAGVGAAIAKAIAGPVGIVLAAALVLGIIFLVAKRVGK